MASPAVPRKAGAATGRRARQLTFLGADPTPANWPRALAARWLAEDGPELPHLQPRVGRACKPFVVAHGPALVEEALFRYVENAPLADAEGRFTRQWPEYRRICPEDFAKHAELYLRIARLSLAHRAHPTTITELAPLFGAGS